MNLINKNLSFFAIILMVVSACSTAEEQIDNSNSIQETESDTDPVKYSLSVGVEGGGTVSTEGGSFDAGTEVTIIATPNPGYVFSGWSDETSVVEKIVTMNSDITIRANFEPLSYPLRINRQQFQRDTNNTPISWEGEKFDYNNDGRPDFVTVNNETGELVFYSGDPNEFNQVQKFTLFNSIDIIEAVGVKESDSLNRAHSIFADLDNDNIVEIITNLQGEWYDVPNFNNGDWNNDGIPNGFFHGSLYIIKNTGEIIEFDSIPSQKFGSIFSIDINGDGYDDILDALPAKQYNSKINVYFNDGTGNLSPASPISYIRIDANTWSDMFYEDLNNDGYKDIVGVGNLLEINYGTSNTEVYNYENIEYKGPVIENDCLGLYQPRPGAIIVPLFEEIYAVDIDNDGIKELLASVGYNGCNKHKNILMYRYNGNNYEIDSQTGFYVENYYTGNAIKFIAKDYDKDGDKDIFTLFFYDGGCNYFSQLNYEGILGNGFFWRNDNGVLVQTEYEFCL